MATISGLRLSRVMEAIAALAVLLAFWTWWYSYRHSYVFDAFTAVVTAISVFVIATALSGAADRYRTLGRWSRGLGVLNLLIALWFVSVEWEWSFEDCPRCHDSRRVFEYRVFSIVVWRDVEQWSKPTIVEMIAADLGIPCSHEKPLRSWRLRLSGLCLCLENGGMRLGDAPWYPPCARAALRSWREQDPDLARRFRERVLEGNDREYLRSLILRLYDACPEDQLPPNPIGRNGSSSG